MVILSKQAWHQCPRRTRLAPIAVQQRSANPGLWALAAGLTPDLPARSAPGAGSRSTAEILQPSAPGSRASKSGSGSKQNILNLPETPGQCWRMRGYSVGIRSGQATISIRPLRSPQPLPVQSPSERRACHPSKELPSKCLTRSGELHGSRQSTVVATGHQSVLLSDDHKHRSATSVGYSPAEDCQPPQKRETFDSFPPPKQQRLRTR